MSRNDAHGVREIRLRRNQVGESALGESAVADFAAAGAAQEFHFADRERREIVVQHEALERLVLEEEIEALLVFLGAERGGDERLRLAAGEESRAVNARQNADLAGDLANLVEGASIGATAADEHVVAEDALAQAARSAR